MTAYEIFWLVLLAGAVATPWILVIVFRHKIAARLQRRGDRQLRRYLPQFPVLREPNRAVNSVYGSWVIPIWAALVGLMMVGSLIFNTLRNFG